MTETSEHYDQEADTAEQAQARRGRPISEYLIEKLNAKVDYAASLEARIARLEAIEAAARGFVGMERRTIDDTWMCDECYQIADTYYAINHKANCTYGALQAALDDAEGA